MDIKQFSGDKILKHKSRINEFFKTSSSKPITVELDMTNVCNHDCPYCFGYFNRKENVNHITLDEGIDIVNQLKNAGTLAITFTGGGDPLVNKNTIEVMEHAKKIGLDVALITNGLALNSDISKRAINICTWIRVSVDADSHETYFKTHGVGKIAWNKMLENIQALVDIKNEINSKCTIGVGYLTMPGTISQKQMLSFVKLFKKIGVDYSQFRPIMPRWNESKNVEQDGSIAFIDECLKESTDNYDVLFSKPKYDLMKEDKSHWRPYKKCLGVNFTTTISADRKVYVCCHHRGISKYAIGDLSKEKFADIWNRRQKTFDKIDFKD